MSFHPRIEYADVPQVGTEAGRGGRRLRLLAGEPGEVRRDRRRTIRPTSGSRRSSTRSIWCSSSRATSPAPACGTSPRQIGCTPAEVEDVVSYYTMFYTKPVGKYVINVCRTLSCALLGAERVTEELSAKLGIASRADDAGRHVHADGSGMPRRLRPRAGGDGQRRLARAAGAGAGVRSSSTTSGPAAGRRSPAATCTWRR